MHTLEIQGQRLGWMAIPVESPVLKTGDDRLTQLYLYLKKRSRRFKKDLTWKGEEITLLPGDFIFGRNAVAQEIGIPATTCRDKLYKLVKLGLVSKVKDLIGASVWRFLDNPLPVDPATKEKSQSKPVCHNKPATNTPLRGLERKKNTNGKGWIHTNEEVVASSPVIRRADLSGALKRFAETANDFLRWLLEQAEKIAKLNPIGLVLHWLQTGKMNGMYADLLKSRKRQQQLKERRILKEQQQEKEREIRQKERLIELAEKRQEIESNPKELGKFAKMLEKAKRSRHAKVFLNNLTMEQVLNDPDYLELVLNLERNGLNETQVRYENQAFAV